MEKKLFANNSENDHMSQKCEFLTNLKNKINLIIHLEIQRASGTSEVILVDVVSLVMAYLFIFEKTKALWFANT